MVIKGPYLIFVIFLHRQNFWRIKFTPKKRVNYDKLHSKLPILRVNYDKLHSKLPIFCVKSVKKNATFRIKSVENANFSR